MLLGSIWTKNHLLRTQIRLIHIPCPQEAHSGANCSFCYNMLWNRGMLKTFLEQTVSFLQIQKNCYNLGYQVLTGLRAWGNCHTAWWGSEQGFLQRALGISSALFTQTWERKFWLEESGSLTYSPALFLLSSWCWVLCSHASVRVHPPVMWCLAPHTSTLAMPLGSKSILGLLSWGGGQRKSPTLCHRGHDWKHLPHAPPPDFSALRSTY